MAKKPVAPPLRALSERRVDPVNASETPRRVTTKQPLSAPIPKGKNNTGMKL